MHTHPRHPVHRRTRTRSAVGATLALSVVAAACGSSSDASPSWCDAVGDLDAAIGRIAAPDEAALQQAFSDLAPVGDRLADDAPKKIRAAAREVAGAIDDAVETGQPTLFTPPTSTAMAEMHAYAADECQYESVAVEATDYAFTGMPASVPAGRVALSFDNVSAHEEHELVLFAKEAGVDQPLAELLEMPEEEARAKANAFAFVYAEPGQRSGLIVDLEPGEYGIACFVPVGGNEDGAPHFVHGMVMDFVVA